MICTACGHDNPDRAEFCLACRAFLGWADPAADTAEQPPAGRPTVPPAGFPVTGPAGPPATGPAGPRADGQPAGADAAEPGRPATPRVWAVPAGSGTTTLPPGAGEPTAGPATDSGSGPAGPAAGPEPVRGTARRPDERAPERPRPAAATPALRQPSGDLYCPSCGTGNARSRVLCERCGARLEVPEAAPESRPWWRVLPRRPERRYQAGERPRSRRWRRPRVSIPILVIALVVAGLAVRGQVGRLSSLMRDEITTPGEVNPVHERASSAAPGHPAAAAFDGANNRCWMPRPTGNGAGQYLEADFRPPVRLLKVIVLSGCSADKDAFLHDGRPRQLTMVTMSRAGHVQHVLALADQPGQQTFSLRDPDVTRVRFTVESSYGARPNTRVAIAEIEFFGRT